MTRMDKQGTPTTLTKRSPTSRHNYNKHHHNNNNNEEFVPKYGSFVIWVAFTAMVISFLYLFPSRAEVEADLWLAQVEAEAAAASPHANGQEAAETRDEARWDIREQGIVSSLSLCVCLGWCQCKGEGDRQTDNEVCCVMFVHAPFHNGK